MARDRDRRPDNRFKEFEFGEEDERSEKETKLLLAKLKRKERRHSGSPVDHYKFLQCFASVPAQQRETRNTPIDIDEEEICNTKSRRKKTNDARTDRKGEVARVAKIHRSETNIRPIDLGSGGCLSTYPATCQMGTLEVKNIKQTSSLGSLSVPSKDEGQDVGLISDDDDDDLIEMSSSSTFASPLVEKKVLSQERLSVSGTNEPESAAEAGKVYIYPDFIIHGELYCTTALLTFSNAAFMVEGLTVNGTDETLSFRWAIEDIISIESEWCGRVETAFTSLLLRSKNSKTADNANPASEIESFRISVHDPYWSEKEVAIKSLSVKYMDKWKIIYNIDKENGEDDLWRQNYEVSSKPYFSDLDKSFEEFIYPEGDPDAVLIRRKDVELLRPQTFINDTIIDFYIKYLKNKLQPEEQKRFHFFNCFFFRKLADLDKYPSSASEARAAFERVRKWTRKVDIFEKDYIFIPVNYSLHWSLIIICHPGEVANLKDSELDELHKSPCILHMDSIKGSHRGLSDVFRSYLREEWKERHKDAADSISSKFSQLQFIPQKLPQQGNSFDCGLFLLHYVELFIREAPTNFIPSKIGKSSKFLTKDWFPPVEASRKRPHIKRLINEVLKDQSQKASVADSIDECPLSHPPDLNDQEAELQILGEFCSSAKTPRDLSSNCNASKGIEDSKSESSHKFANKKFEEPAAFEDLLKLGNYGGLYSSKSNQQYNTPVGKNFMSPIEEIEETCEKMSIDKSSDKDGETASISQQKPQPLMLTEDSCSGTSSNDFHMFSMPELEGTSHLEKTYESSPASSGSLADLVVDDSEEVVDESEDEGDQQNYCVINRSASSSGVEVVPLSKGNIDVIDLI